MGSGWANDKTRIPQPLGQWRGRIFGFGGIGGGVFYFGQNPDG
jgi:hypothetical protein